MTEQSIWADVDHYFNGRLLPSDPILESVLETNAAEGLPAVDVTPTQGKFLHLLARIHGARRVLEIGTLGGYSTIWLARALPADGQLITLELEPRHGEVARTNFVRAGLTNMIDLRVGDALDSLAAIHAEGSGKFDFIFIDANKDRNDDYCDWALKLSRKGTLIVVDNTVRNGAVVDSESDNPDVLGVRRLVQFIECEPRINATAVQTVGSKGYDGFILAVVSS